MTVDAPHSTGEVGLFIDLGDPTHAIAVGDWLVTDAGSRYVVLTSRRVQSRGHAQRNRWRMRCARLEKNTPVPPGTAVWSIQWYERRRRR